MDSRAHPRSEKLNAAIQLNCAPLERQDLQSIQRAVSWQICWQELESRVNNSTHPELVGLYSSLRAVKDLVSAQLDPLTSGSNLIKLVGILDLAIKLVEEQSSALKHVSRMLGGLFEKIELFCTVCQQGTEVTMTTEHASIDVGIAILEFCCHIVRFLRSDVVFEQSETRLKAQWQPTQLAYRNAENVIDEATSRVSKSNKRIIPVPAPIEQTSELRPPISLNHHVSAVPHRTMAIAIHPPIRPPRFFDRDDVITTMVKYFSSNEESFRSLALYGLGGVGKSSVAYKYAQTKLQKEELDAFFWIHGEKKETIQRSFSEIAVKLSLPGATATDHETNYSLVMDWLQGTSSRWLLVYDNVEKGDLINHYWPAASRGEAVITTRNRALAFHPADKGLEVREWNAETGSQFLLHLLSNDINRRLGDDDTTSAYNLAKILDGHAQAISIMAGLIHQRQWGIGEFMDIYARNRLQMHGFSAHEAIDTIWTYSYQSLDDHSAAILGAFCFLEPDNIQGVIFEPSRIEALPGYLSFCRNEFAFGKAIETLLRLALIKRDPHLQTFTIHRLVQSSFLHFMTVEQKQQAFHAASTLISMAFPRRNAVAELYNKWKTCALYLPHVQTLKNGFRDQKKLHHEWRALAPYCELNTSCQRYLLEIDDHTALEDLFEVSLMAMDTLPAEAQTVLMRGEHASHHGQMHCRRGRYDEGIQLLQESYTIFSSDVTFDSADSGWAADNLATALSAAKKLEPAMVWHTRAREHFLSPSETDVPALSRWPCSLKTAMSRTCLALGDTGKSQDLLTQALKELKSTRPMSFGSLASAYYAQGNLHRHLRELDQAESCYMEAQNVWRQGDQLRSAPINASCMYKLGCIALDMGKTEAAIKHLEDALSLTRLRMTIFPVEHARVLFKLSEALEQEPGAELRARTLRSDAEEYLRQGRSAMASAGVESAYDDQIWIGWR